jgi:hypothetical protein
VVVLLETCGLSERASFLAVQEAVRAALLNRDPADSVSVAGRLRMRGMVDVEAIGLVSGRREGG